MNLEKQKSLEINKSLDIIIKLLREIVNNQRLMPEVKQDIERKRELLNEFLHRKKNKLKEKDE